MNELTKTFAFVGVALVAVIVAVASRPQIAPDDPTSLEGTTLNAIDDPLRATRLKVVEFLEDKSAVRPFEVAQVDGSWVIPSHQNYPADAKEQMAQAATSVMNLKILGIPTTNAGDHETYGVVAPDLKTLSVGSTGVGTHVTMRDDQEETLVDLIIGKEVKGQEGQRYVREADKDPVYVVKLDPSALKTEFGSWIEKDLLGINPLDVRRVALTRDNVQLALAQGQAVPVRTPGSSAELRYDSKDSKWQVVSLQEQDKATGKLQTVEAEAGSELDDTKLEDLKNALDDLKIVDVERKPEGLSADLRAEKDFMNSRETLQNLAQRGFTPVAAEKGVELVSAEGETICGMKDGVEYVLRFGTLLVTDSSKQESGKEGDEKASGISRYMFVSARVNEDLLEKPELKELPPETSAEEAEQPTATGEEQTETSESEPEATTDESGDEGEAEEKPASGQEEGTDEQPEDGQDAERKKIQAENEAAQKKYDEALKKAQDRVKELNDRFADWYYVVADDVYKKIQLDRESLFKKEEQKESNDAGLGELNPLQQQGLEALGGESQ